jgi:hypothetical protein
MLSTLAGEHAYGGYQADLRGEISEEGNIINVYVTNN